MPSFAKSYPGGGSFLNLSFGGGFVGGGGWRVALGVVVALVVMVVVVMRHTSSPFRMASSIRCA